jgi:hypothetical protein
MGPVAVILAATRPPPAASCSIKKRSSVVRSAPCAVTSAPPMRTDPMTF